MPTLGVNVAIVTGAQVLLTMRADFPVWCLPGGAVEAGETLAQAAIREAREETALEVRLTGLVGTYSRPNWRAGGAHEVLFAAERVGGTLRTTTAETTNAGWFGLAELPKPVFVAPSAHPRRIAGTTSDRPCPGRSVANGHCQPSGTVRDARSGTIADVGPSGRVL
jgi:8-oxo-dGTP diphosphatase